jgi:hypothetical protein
MIAHESELTKNKRTKKVQAALDNGIPFLSADFITNLCERKGRREREKE